MPVTRPPNQSMRTTGSVFHWASGLKEWVSARIDLILGIVLCIVIGRLWLMPLGSSFWVDEMGSVFVVRHGAADPTLRVAPQVAASIYYWLPALTERIAGFSEVTYRFSSVLAMAGALFAIVRLARRLIDAHAGWFVAFACLASRDFNYQADDARPYALGTLVLSVALLKLVRWLDDGRWLDALLFAACAGLLWWVHLVFWPLYLVFIVYGGYRVWTREHRATGAQIAGVAACVLAACIPTGLHALEIARGASAHVVASLPKFGDLLAALKLTLITGVCTLAALASRWSGWTPEQSSVLRRGSVILIAAWWILDPLILFAFSLVTGNSLFLPRYMYVAAPGVALITCALVGVFLPRHAWKTAALALGCGVLVFGGRWGALWPQHQRSDWRTGARSLTVWASGEEVPVICPSVFIEARSPVWRPGYPTQSFLYSHLAVYPTAGRLYTFPFEPSVQARSYARQLAETDLLSAGRFAIFGGDQNVNYWRNWFAAEPALRDWKSSVRGIYGDVELVTFESPNRQSAGNPADHNEPITEASVRR